MKKYIPILLLILTSCEFAVDTNTETNTRIESGKSIDEKIRYSIAEKNQFVVDCIQRQKSQEISEVASEHLIEEGFNEVIPSFDYYGSLMSTNEFSVFGEYHAKTSEPRVQIEIGENFNRGGDTSQFELRYRSMAEETYLSLLTHNMGTSELLITALYGNYNGEWELDLISLSALTAYGMTSPEFYYESQKFKDEGDIVNAYLFSLFAELTLEPCEGIFYYDRREEIIEYSKTLKGEYEEKITLPDTMFNVKSQPVIAGLGVKISPNLDYLPWVQYFTFIDPSNAEGINAERSEVAKEIESIFPGISRNFKTHMYEAYVPE